MVIFFTSVITIFIGWFCLWYSSLGLYEPAEHWLNDVMALKERRATEIRGPKIVIVSGSNALFGIDSHLLERLQKKPVLNMATHGGLPLAYHMHQAVRNSGPGDLVVMPLELSYYSMSSNVPTTWEMTNLQTWGWRYIAKDLPSLVHYFRYAQPADAIRRLLRFTSLPATPSDVLNATADENSRRIIPLWQGYNYKSVNARGDIFVRRGDTEYESNDSYDFGNVQPYAAKLLRDTRKQVEARGARLVLIWPVTFKNPAFDLTGQEAQRRVAALENSLTAAGLTMLCEAVDFQFNQSYSFQTRYHLGAHGAVLRTAALSQCIDGERPDRSFGQALLTERLREASTTNPCPLGEVVTLMPPFQRQGRSGYESLGPFFLDVTDTNATPGRSPVVVCESGHALGPAHSLIAQIGDGRFSHYMGAIYFSAFDNSDPNSNGHTYTIVLPEKYDRVLSGPTGSRQWSN